MAYEKGNGKTVVIALGGNALGNTPAGAARARAEHRQAHRGHDGQDGTNVVVSHGNGPQVGMINNAFAYAAANDGKTPDMPFPEAGAMSQGYIGYQLSQAILNDLKSPRHHALDGLRRDPDRRLPGRPGVPEPHQARGRLPGRGRRPRPSAPRPPAITVQGGRRPRLAPGGRLPEPQAHRGVRRRASDLMDDGYIVVSTGGGGVPVIETRRTATTGVPAVIDKDRSSALSWPPSFSADMLVILTAVEKVCINFNTPEQEADRLRDDRVAEAREVHRRRASSHPARMLPKVRGLHRVRARRIPRARRSSRRSSARPPACKRRDGHRHRRRLGTDAQPVRGSAIGAP